MLHRIYLHVVWTTRDRAALIDAPLARFLVKTLRVLARRERSYILEVGMVQTHVHLLVRIRPTTLVASLVKRLKGASSALATQERYAVAGARLYWAKGYSVHSVSERALETVRHYLRGQPRHHPTEAIPGWEGDTGAEYDAASLETMARH
jgi:REP-associated tyrosine transposase